jgi:hypothetical protein
VTGSAEAKQESEAVAAYTVTLHGLRQAAAWLGNLVDRIITATDWEDCRTAARLIDQHVGLIAGDVNVYRAWLELCARQYEGPALLPVVLHSRGSGDPA